jgi:O-antigen/teichoic acid export membrane protein
MIKTQLAKIKSSALARNAGWMFAGQGLSFVVQGLYFVILARVLGSLQYGILAGAAALVTVVSQYSTMGSGLLFLRYVSPDHEKFREYWGNILLSTAVFGSILVIGVRFAGTWMIGPASASILVLLAIGDCMCGQLTAAAGQVFQTFEKMRITASLNLMTNLFRLILAAGMLIFLHHASAWQWAVASLTVSLLAVITAIVTVTVRFGWPIFRPVLMLKRLGEGSIFAVSGSTTSVYNDIDKVMLGHYGMTIANGIYTMAYRVVNIAAMPIMSIQAAAFPRFFREGVNGVTATEPFARKILKRTALIGALGAAGMFLFAPIIPHLVGKGFSQSVNALRWLCLIPLFRCMHVGAGDAMAGAGYQKYRLGAQAIAAGGNFLLNLYLIPRYSWFGAAVASLLTDGSLAIMSWSLLFWLKSREARKHDGKGEGDLLTRPVVEPESAELLP